MSHAAKFMFMLVILMMLMESGNWGSVASTQELAAHIGALQSSVKGNNDIAVISPEDANKQFRNTNIDFGSGSNLSEANATNNNSDVTDNVNNIPSDSSLYRSNPLHEINNGNVGNVLTLPGKNGEGYGQVGLSILPPSMVQAVSPAGYAIIILMRLSDEAVETVIATATPTIDTNIENEEVTPQISRNLGNMTPENIITPYQVPPTYTPENTPTPYATLTPRPTKTPYPTEFSRTLTPVPTPTTIIFTIYLKDVSTPIIQPFESVNR